MTDEEFIAAEFGSTEQMVEHAKRHAAEVVMSSNESDDDPLAVVVRGIQVDACAGEPLMPAAYWAAAAQELERLIEEWRIRRIASPGSGGYGSK